MLKRIRILAAAIILLATNTVFGQGSMFSVRIDNDIFNFFDQTDRFYSNGVFVEAFHPVFSKSPLAGLLISDAKHSQSVTGISISQDIYTPSTTRSNQVLIGDRPYASTLLVAQTRIAYNTSQHYRIQNSIGVGLLGKPSGGESVQNLVHKMTANSDLALGWQHQIATDLLIDYNIGLEKGLVNSKLFQLNATASAQLGTLRDQLGFGFSLYAGYFEDLFSNPFGFCNTQSFSIKFFDEFSTQYLAYDATLQGGVFNHNSEYSLRFEDVNHVRLNNTFGVEFATRSFSAKVGRTWQSPEFSAMPHHAWGYFQFRWRF